MAFPIVRFSLALALGVPLASLSFAARSPELPGRPAHPQRVVGSTTLGAAADTAALAQQARKLFPTPPTAPATPALVFDHVTVVDVEHGALLTNQRVVIAGTRIRAMGNATAVTIPAGARVVEAAGKYLIPGLWDMHVHTNLHWPSLPDSSYQLLLASGITGMRDAGTPVPLDTLHLWRREILAGTRVGPPRQILSGQAITGPWPKCDRSKRRGDNQTCVADAADAVHYVDSLKAAGADMIKPREVLTPALYAAIAAESRRVGLPFGGHASYVTELEASDHGATIIDHRWGDAGCAYNVVRLSPDQMVQMLRQGGGVVGGDVDSDAAKEALLELGGAATVDGGRKPGDPALESCWKQAAERFRRNGTWFVPTLTVSEEPYALANFHSGLLLLAGTDAPAFGHSVPFGVSLHEELSRYVAHGLTPLEALQTATLNPARMLRATDSLGTVAVGKLADLVLLDANPLANIQNTRKIHAVVANGRYFDRAALDKLIAAARTTPKGTATPP